MPILSHGIMERQCNEELAPHDALFWRGDLNMTFLVMRNTHLQYRGIVMKKFT
jgi:hypothetical protein